LKEDEFSWKAAAFQRALEGGNRGIAIVRSLTRKRLVKTLQAGKGLACAGVICELWKSATGL
jgi:hypothetical protein